MGSSESSQCLHWYRPWQHASAYACITSDLAKAHKGILQLPINALAQHGVVICVLGAGGHAHAPRPTTEVPGFMNPEPHPRAAPLRALCHGRRTGGLAAAPAPGGYKPALPPVHSHPGVLRSARDGPDAVL